MLKFDQKNESSSNKNDKSHLMLRSGLTRVKITEIREPISPVTLFISEKVLVSREYALI